ncbi:hypothetical protein HYX04_01310 [Candidatus Woesearchaeota archaeon]|nr:hypothetical protein [Candidatus Woesearchaeota archaeon]
MEYDFAREFVEDKITEDKFLAKMIERVETDKNFRTETGIISLEIQDLKKIVDTLKKHKRIQKPSKREFLKMSGLAVGGLVAKKVEAFAIEDVSARKFYEEILKMPQLKPTREPIFSRSPNTPIVIIVEDIHGGLFPGEEWYVEFGLLELIRKKFGLNFVGIEGWAGHEADRIRGRQILNAEVQLIKALLSNKNYQIIGLENPEIQIKGLELSLAQTYGRLQFVQDGIYKELRSHNIEDSKIKRAFDSIYLRIDRDKIISDLLANSPVRKEEKVIKFLRLELSVCILQLNFIVKMLYLLYNIKNFNKEVIEERKLFIQKKYPRVFEHSASKIDKNSEVDNVVNNQREEFAVKRMLQAMQEFKQKVGIVVFGEGHTDGLIKEFIKQTAFLYIFKSNINIIVIKHK